MIISFDGNVFSGKTSLIEALFSLGKFNLIGEHSSFLNTDIFTHNVTASEMATLLQHNYLEAEARRRSYIKVDEVNLIDRSFVSMAAHISALNSVRGIDIREWFLKEFNERLRMGKILVPDIYCFVRCGYDTIVERVGLNNSRNTDPIYYEERYLKAIQDFNQAWSSRVGGTTIDTETVIPIRLAETLIQQIPVSSQGGLDTQKIQNYLIEIVMK